MSFLNVKTEKTPSYFVKNYWQCNWSAIMEIWKCHWKSSFLRP